MHAHPIKYGIPVLCQFHFTWPPQPPPLAFCTSVACVVGPSVNSSSTDFSFQNLLFFFFWNLFEFSAAEIT